MTHAAIYSLAFELPTRVRDNAWWSEETVQQWQNKRRNNVFDPSALEQISGWPRRIIEEMGKTAASAFLGCERRHVFGEDEEVVELELRVARDALSKAKVEAGEIDFLLSFSGVPDFLHTSGNAPLIHHRLGLRRDCRTQFVEAACNSFQAQLDLAELIISSGRGKKGLLVQSAAASRLMPYDDQTSVLFGDGATAQVVGPAKAGFGVLGAAHLTDGSVFGATVTSVPKKRWFDAGVNVFHARDRALSRGMLMSLGDVASDVASRALAQAELQASDVKFFAGHQAAEWVQRIMKEAAGVSHAKHIETFPYCGTLSASNLPASLTVGAREGLLVDGDIVLLCAGASGQTASATVIRWGGH